MPSTRQGTASQTQVPHLDDAMRDHFDRAAIGMLLLGEDRRILSANQALARFAGINASVLSGSSLGRFLWSDSAADIESRIFDEVERDGRWLGEVDFRSSIGDSSPTMLSIVAVDAEGKGPVRYVVTVVELGQQRWIEAESFRRAQELAAFSAIAVATGGGHDSQEMLAAAARQVVEGLDTDACWIHRFDPEDDNLSLVAEASYLNPSIKLSPRMLPGGASPGVRRVIQTRELVAESELLDRSIATVVHLPLLARGELVGVLSILSIAGEKLSTRDSDLLRAVSYQIGAAVQNVRLVESVRRHEAELQQNNERLGRLVERLRTTDRMKSEFLANTSHELRTPLNSIIGFLNLVLDDLCQDEGERKEMLKHAVQSSRHLLDLINDVLDLSRIEAGRLEIELEPVRLAPILEDIRTTFAVQVKAKGLEFELETVPPEVAVMADAARLRQILVNVLGNAIKFTAQGSVSLRVTALPDRPFVEIQVTDTGIGIAKDRREFLFQKFSQADASTTRRFGGSGLGLVIVKELAEMMGGTVRIDSPGEDRGTTLWISLARADATGG